MTQKPRRETLILASVNIIEVREYKGWKIRVRAT